MKNTATKILILAAVVVIAIAGILAFYPTIVAPPTKVPIENLHKMSVENNISELSDIKSVSYNDSLFNLITDKIAVYEENSFLTSQESDHQTKSFVQKYLPIFTASCFKRFQASVWRESDHTAMLSRIKDLRILTIDGGSTKAVTGSYSDDLNKIERIIERYKKAKDAAKHNSFYSVNDANAKIQSAESFAQEEYLKNCTELVNKLLAVKTNIGNSHYAQVESVINELANYRNMSEPSFDELVTRANSKIQEYNSNRSKYGSAAKNTDQIKNRANEYYKAAKQYYESLRRPDINVVYSPQWTTYTSPNSNYRAYQSSSNYNRHNEDATMYFTIKGYESFSFYIRSNGESQYDYIIVDINKRPTTATNYANTKGQASSGTALYNYKTVTFNNLSKDSEYTIYVTYHKDGSNNAGTDRGYILIPYTNN